MSVGTDDEEVVAHLMPLAQGVRSQSTQTQEPPAERMGGPLGIGSPLPAQQQNSAAERVGLPSVESQVQSLITQVQTPTSLSPARGPAAESPHGLGRCDLFGRDQDRVDLERERRRLQAQMLAEQVEEQRKRKEEEKRKRKEEEMLEDQRIERERRELEERHAREKGRLKNAARSHANVDSSAPPGQADPQPPQPPQQGGRPPERRKRTPLRMDSQQEPQAGNTTEPESSRGFWADAGGAADAAVARRRRRRRRTDASTGTTWRSGHQQSWRDPQVDSTGIPTQSRRQSQSPSPWLSQTGQETPHATRSVMREKESWHEQADVLSTVRESSQESRKPRTAEARQRRRRVRERTRERQESRYVEQWMSPSAASGRPPGEGTTSWQEEEPREARYIGGRGRRQRSGSHPQLDERVHADGPSPLPLERKSPKLSDEKSLHQQLGSLVSLCEQLLKERAERDRADRERLERDRLDRMERGERTERSERSEHRSHSERGDRSERSERSKRIEHDGDRGMRAVGSGAALEAGVPRAGPQRSSSRKRSASKRLLVHDSQFLAPGTPGGEERWSPRAPHAVAAAAPNGGGPNSGLGSGAVSARSHGSQGAKARSHSGRSRAGHAGHSNHTNGEGGPDAAINGHRSAGRPQPLPADQYAMPVSANDWPPDALAGFMAEAVGHLASNEVAVPRPRPRRLGDIDESPSPFAVPNARGMAVPRHSQGQGYGARLVMSPPPPVSRGGLNLQAHWPAFGRSSIGPEDAVVSAAAVVNAKEAARGPGREAERQRGMYDDVAFENADFGSPAPGGVSNGEARMDVADWYQSPGPKHVGPGHIPIEIRPSIQAQSAMLRELYPRGPMAAGAAGPLPAL